ncbi:hypothetical protein ABE65_016230 [Fictibacillus phosphorivorans]|uniref:DUF4935 domain-containing protein n=1 Tax=Fictibacillus phosphorivorans TaxID=1221500 RepID=A0A160IPC5_9BACL|nr:PIN domain-containing protein [Fictibacillus phosphorivorans]ANC78263.1 hypothetical protein ABE65_016230 [Fictibacillus phosphorivorans]
MKPKIALCLDTNIFLNLFESGKHDVMVFNKFLTSILMRHCILVIIDQVKVEWNRHVEKNQEEFLLKTTNTIESHKSLLNFLEQEEEKQKLDNTIESIKRLEKRRYKFFYGKRAEKLKQLIDDKTHTQFIDRTPNAEKLVVNFAIDKKAPFFSNELNGAKTKIKTEAADASIFFTLYDNIMNGNIDYEKIYFVTDNKKDYSKPENPSCIHDNLLFYATNANIIFSNSIEGVLSEIFPENLPINDYLGPLDTLYLTDPYFEKCPLCNEEVHINGDSFIGAGPPHEQTYWLKCRCGHEWDTHDLVHDIY